MRQSHRAKGGGTVSRRCDSGQNKYGAYATQARGERELIGKFPTRWHAERALNAWHFVQFLAWLPSLNGASEALSA